MNIKFNLIAGFLSLGVAFFISSTSFCYSQLYKYIDANGVVSYTDDYSKISKEQKGSMEVIEEEKIEFSEILSGNEPKDEKQLGNSSNDLLESERIELTQIEASLNKEYSAISIESDKLAKEEINLVTNEDKNMYIKNINQLNSRIRDYTKKKKAYKKRAEDYNRRISLK